MAIEHIDNLEPGYSVRQKLNAAIDVANATSTTPEDLQDHLLDYANPHRTSLGNLTNVQLDVTKPGQGLHVSEDGLSWVNRTNREEAWPTGLADGGELNIGPGINDVEVIAGLGVIIDSYTAPLEPPVVKAIEWPQINEDITAAPAQAGSVVWLSIRDTGIAGNPIGNAPTFLGELIQYATAPSPTLGRQEIFLGVIVHNGVTWNEVSSPKVVNQAAETLREVAATVLPLASIIQGGTLTEVVNFEINQAAGTLWSNNVNWHVSKSDPNREPLAAAEPISFQYVNRDFTYVETPDITVDPTIWDNAGTVEAVPGPANATTIQRLFLDPAGNYWCLLGQNVYTNFLEAQAVISRDNADTVFPFILQNSIFLAYIISEKAKTDWDIDEAVLLPGDVPGGSSGGTPITEHDNLSGITPDNHHDAMEAKGSFIQGATYSKGAELFNGSDLSQALVDGVTSSPFVAPTGEAFDLFQGTMLDTAQLAKQIYFGNRYKSADDFYITGYRVNTVIGNEYSVYAVADPGLVGERSTLLRTFTAVIDGWNTYNIAARAVIAGQGFDIIAIVNEPDPTPVDVTTSYSYLTPQNITVPVSGQLIQARGAPSLQSVHYIDNNAVDRTATVQGLSIGDEIDIGAFTYAVQSNTDMGAYADIIVAPAVAGTSGNQDVIFRTTEATPISVAEDLAYWAASDFPQVQGLKGVDIPYDDIVPDDNAYGTDIIVQAAYIPDPAEWWLKIVAGQGGGGASGFIPTVFAGPGTSGYVPDPITEQGLVLGDSGEWVQGGGGGSGATEAIIQQVAHGFKILDCVRHNGTEWVLAQADSIDTTALGVVVNVNGADTFTYAITGRYEITHGLSPDEWYWLSTETPGGLDIDPQPVEQPIVYTEGTTYISIYAYRPSVEGEPETTPLAAFGCFGADQFVVPNDGAVDTIIPFDTQQFNNAEEWLSFDDTTGVVTFSKSCNIQLSFAVPLEQNVGADNRQTFKTSAFRAGAIMTLTQVYTYHRDGAQPNDRDTAVFSGSFPINAGQTLDIRTVNYSGGDVGAGPKTINNCHMHILVLDAGGQTGATGRKGADGADGGIGKNLCYNGMLTVWPGSWTSLGSVSNSQRYFNDGWCTLSSSSDWSRESDEPDEGIYAKCVRADNPIATVYCPIELLNQQAGTNNGQFPIGTVITYTRRVRAPVGANIQFRMRYSDRVIAATLQNDEIPWTDVATGTGDWEDISITHTITETAISGALVFSVGLLVNDTVNGTSVEYDVKACQVEFGNAFTGYELVENQRENARCQRYRWRFLPHGMNFASSRSTDFATWLVNFPVTMYTTPTPVSNLPGIIYTWCQNLSMSAPTADTGKMVIQATSAQQNCFWDLAQGDWIDFEAQM
jgi:hypothetical protein